MSLASLKVLSHSWGIDNAFARMPFRFGIVTMEFIASMTIKLDVMVGGVQASGYASDLLSYKWFDKRPNKTLEENIQDLIWVIGEAIDVAKSLPASNFFDFWRSLDAEIHARAIAADFNHLGASFGVSMVERAVLDAIGRAQGSSFFELVKSDVLGLNPAEIFPELANATLATSLPYSPRTSIAVRHTIGLIDPLDNADLPADQRRNDGLPETLKDYIEQDGIAFLKIKVNGNHDADIARLEKIATILKSYDRKFTITLDGNEQYKSIDDFAALMQTIRATPALAQFYSDTILIEQPLDRAVAFAAPLDANVRALIGKPLLIDEADGWTTAFREAIDLGYHGVSHKNCKGVTRSLLNAMLCVKFNETAGTGSYFQTAEDLTCLPIVSLQADLAVAATLGVSHIERNGHHYFSGLNHLPASEAEAALNAHPDLYTRANGMIMTNIANGMLSIGSLQTPGMGFSTLPDLSQRVSPSNWTFASLSQR